MNAPHRYTVTHLPTGKTVTLVCPNEAAARREVVGVLAAAMVLLDAKAADFSETVTPEN